MAGVIKRAVLINDFIGVGFGLTALDRARDLEVLHNGVWARAVFLTGSSPKG